jgi:hypothetical protein
VRLHGWLPLCLSLSAQRSSQKRTHTTSCSPMAAPSSLQNHLPFHRHPTLVLLVLCQVTEKGEIRSKKKKQRRARYSTTVAVDKATSYVPRAHARISTWTHEACIRVCQGSPQTHVVQETVSKSQSEKLGASFSPANAWLFSAARLPWQLPSRLQLIFDG